MQFTCLEALEDLILKHANNKENLKGMLIKANKEYKHINYVVQI